VDEGDKVIPTKGKKNTFAWQRAIARREELAAKVALDLAMATSDGEDTHSSLLLRHSNGIVCQNTFSNLLPR
jgi:hypothetical protein